MDRILVIEDEPLLRRQLGKVLRYAGFEALEAEDGKVGLAAAQEHLPDVIICDIMMPELDGFGVLAALRKDPRTATIPFIFVTALMSADDRRQGMEQGADDYITKPYHPAELIASVRRRLEKRKLQLEENRRRAEEVSMAVTNAVPAEIMEALDRITDVTTHLEAKYGSTDTQTATMYQTAKEETVRLRRTMRRMHLYVSLPQLYAEHAELGLPQASSDIAQFLERGVRTVCKAWNRESDLRISAPPASVPLGEEYLMLIIDELLDNACKFSPTGTPLEVETQPQPGSWVLTVRNRGLGLTPEQIARIGAFQQFWSGLERPRGLGLGLAIVQCVARLHGLQFSLRTDNDVTIAQVMIPLAS